MTEHWAIEYDGAKGPRIDETDTGGPILHGSEDAAEYACRGYAGHYDARPVPVALVPLTNELRAAVAKLRGYTWHKTHPAKVLCDAIDGGGDE